MLHGTYIEDAPDQHLQSKSALLQQDPDKPENFIAQFDDVNLYEAFGWHSFPKKWFVNLEGEQ